MRTTIEMSESHRAELLRVAAKRGLKGFSVLVEEALTEYLSKQTGRQHLVDAAIKLRGMLSDQDADELSDEASRARQQWR